MRSSAITVWRGIRIDGIGVVRMRKAEAAGVPNEHQGDDSLITGLRHAAMQSRRASRYLLCPRVRVSHPQN